MCWKYSKSTATGAIIFFHLFVPTTKDGAVLGIPSIPGNIAWSSLEPELHIFVTTDRCAYVVSWLLSRSSTCPGLSGYHQQAQDDPSFMSRIITADENSV